MGTKKFLLGVVLALVAACSSDPIVVGGACKNAGKTEECVDKAICSNDKGGTYCRATCTDQAQCSATESCNGVTGSSTKSCQPK